MKISNRAIFFLASAPLWAQSPLQLSEIRPNQGLAGASVNLTAVGGGFFAGFVGSAAVLPGSTIIWRRNGVETRLATTFVSSNTLTTTIPSTLMVNAPGTAEILVENGSPQTCDGPCQRSSALTFTILSPLQLTSLNPNRAPTRTATGAPQDFVLNGQGFAGNASVFWQSTAGAAFIELEVLTRSSTAIQARIPQQLLTTPGTANVFVRNPGTSDFPAAASNTLPFTIFPALRLDRLDPTALPAGSPNSKVTAFGSGFTANTRIGFRDLGGTRIPSTQVVNVSLGTIEVTVGADLLTTAKTWQVIAIDGNSITDPLAFQVTAGVTLSSISPTTRPAGGSGQFELAANGTGFTDDAVILFGNTVLNPFNRTSTLLRANVTPQATAGTVNVSVRSNGLVSNSLPFTFTAPPPTISSLSPASRPVNSGDFDLTIAGQNLSPNPTVIFGGQSVAVVGTPTADSVTVRVPNARIAQIGNIAVVVSVNNVDSNSLNFQVTAGAPNISSLSPATLAANSGDFDLTITGTNLAPSPAVTFGGQSVPITGTPTATSITVRVPNARIQQVGSVNVVVRVANIDSNSLPFQVTQAATAINSLSPTARPAGSGDFTLTINGQSLTPNPSVTFGGQAVSITGTPTATSIQVQIPNARIQQAGPVEVRVQVGTFSATATFTVSAPNIPPVTVSPGAGSVPSNGNTTASIVLSGPAPVAVTGTLELSFAPNAAAVPAGYADPAMVFVSGSQRRVAFTIDPGQTTAQIPGGGAFNVGTVAGVVTVSVITMNAAGTSVANLPQPTTVTVPRAGPSITPGSARLTNSTGGVTIEVQGYSPTREITQATITFTIAAGATSGGSTTFVVPLTAPFTTWFDSDTGRNNGSRFLLQIPFTVPEGDPNQITGFSIILANSVGSSATVNGGR
jgi:hypothetical protein